MKPHLIKTALVILFVFFIATASAGTSITTPTVSGHWTVAGSPYNIYNSITINIGDTLIIDPGVEVVLQGPYNIDARGSLYSVGTAAQPISYHVQDTTGFSGSGVAAGGWDGISFGYGFGYDSSSFQYCNVSDMKNGYIFINFASMFINYCNFSHSTTVLDAIISNTQNLEIAHCNIYNNNSAAQIASIEQGSVNVHDCKVYNNTSVLNTFSVEYATLLFINNEIYQNTQTDSSDEGALEVAAGQAVIAGNKIHHNTSKYIAALSCGSSNVDINGNLFCNNSALTGAVAGIICGLVEGGGGIRLISSDYPDSNFIYTVRDNVIANNFAGFAGGAIYIMEANVNVFNNQIINNTGVGTGPGIFIDNGLDTLFVKVKNNIFYNNTLTTAGEPYATDVWTTYNYSLEFDHNWSQWPFYEGVYTLTPFLLVGDTSTDIIGTSPGLVAPTITNAVTEDASTANFSLGSTSPCINAGDTTGATPDSVDYAGNPRISGGIIDIGAFEYQFPDTTTTDTTTTPTTVVNGSILSALNVYPNPAVSLFLVSTPQPFGTLVMRDIMGKVVAEKTVINILTSFDIHAMPRGMYFVVWNDGNTDRAVQKVVLE